MKDCIFCKIVEKKAKAFIIYEDELVLVFLDINPVSEGHLLVIPKKHYENVFSASDEILGKINIVCRKMGQLCKDKLSATGINILNASGKDAQQSAFHLHYHVVPRSKDDNINLWFPEHAKNTIQLQETYNKLTKN